MEERETERIVHVHVHVLFFVCLMYMYTHVCNACMSMHCTHIYICMHTCTSAYM